MKLIYFSNTECRKLKALKKEDSLGTGSECRQRRRGEEDLKQMKALPVTSVTNRGLPVLFPR
jgi:hypothetical protein